jgi:hypothetical protein
LSLINQTQTWQYLPKKAKTSSLSESVSDNESDSERWNHKLSDDQLKEKAEKYPRPANCDKVVSPRVNPEMG